MSLYVREGLRTATKIETRQVLQGPFLNLSLACRLRLATVALVEGEFYNYPPCCITSYINTLLAGWKPGAQRWITHSLKGTYTGYVLCEDHATQLAIRLRERELPDAPV